MKVAALITEICKDFINKKINLEDFQRKLSLVIIEDDAEKYLQEVLYTVDNKLEEIRFCSLELNYYSYGVEVAKNLLEEVKIKNY